MREIKFRAWDKTCNQMGIVTDLKALALGSAVSFDGGETWCLNFELMQYTSLKDKNGREIYEGDIVTVIDVGEELYTAIVECDAPDGGFNLRGSDGEYIELNYQDLIIVGNIYENGALLDAY